MSRRSPSDIRTAIWDKQKISDASRLIVRNLGGLFPDGASATSIESSSRFYGTPAVRNPDLDITFDCYGYDRLGNKDQGVISLSMSMEGTWSNITILSDPIVLDLSLSGNDAFSALVNADPIVLNLSLHVADFTFDGVAFLPFSRGKKANWVKWSNIGSIDFTIYEDGKSKNVAGERPLDWKGFVHSVKKLGDKVIAYGENGVSYLNPVGNVYGLRTIYPVGLLGKHAVTGDDSRHYFIDKKGQMWKVALDSFTKLDYSEYLSALNSNVVMSYDSSNNLIYICDGSLGFVFNSDNTSLGSGPSKITGVGYQSGTLYVGASSAVITEPFSICTDIYDFRTRRYKTIHSIEVGTDLSADLYAAIDYRREIQEEFSTTTWCQLSEKGKAYPTAFGKEFRIRLKTLVYDYFEVDYITVNGVVHAN